MTPAPASGRTADENEMREQIRKAIVAAMPENIPLRGRMAWSIMAAVVDPILQEAATARKERDEARRDHDALAQWWKMNPSLMQHRIAATEQEAATLRARLQEAEKENGRLRIAFHDATRRPLGVTPDSGAEFYDPRMADEAEARRAQGGPPA